MKLFLFLALSLVPLVAGQGGGQGGHGNCEPDTISLDEKLRLNGEANDHDNNQIVDFSDLEYDFDHNYDKNNDGRVTEQEWIDRWTCAFGDTEYFARFAFAMIGAGETEIVTAEFDRPPFNTTGIPLDNFLAFNRDRYVRFNNSGCINSDLTIDEKLELNAAHNDHNNDGKVTSGDIHYDLNNNYDTNGDGKVTQEEWVLEWICAYGDSVEYAVYVWNAIANGAESIQGSDFNGEPFQTGIPIENFKAMNRQRYENFAGSGPVGK